MVIVGNPGNAHDTHGDGYGGVDYVFDIGSYEVTAGQYTEFLNAVAATDTYGLYSPFMDSYPDGCQITQIGEPGSYTYDFSGRPSGTEADWIGRPVNLVSWGEAALTMSSLVDVPATVAAARCGGSAQGTKQTFVRHKRCSTSSAVRR